jgi:hypothetical protein
MKTKKNLVKDSNSDSGLLNRTAQQVDGKKAPTITAELSELGFHCPAAYALITQRRHHLGWAV